MMLGEFSLLIQEAMILFIYLNVAMLLIWPFFLYLEKRDPVHTDIGRSNYWFNWKISLSNVLLGPLFVATVFTFSLAVSQFLGAPFFDYPTATLTLGIPLLDTLIIGACMFLVSCFLGDFSYYWWHRLQHTTPALWELHKLHHSEERMNTTTMPRSHFLEQSGQAFFRGLSVGLVFDLSQQGQTTLAIIAGGLLPPIWNFFIHSNVRADALNALVPYFSTPQYHRLHHSRLPEHQDTNFAVFFPVFDIVFGSYCKPKPGEFPPTGLSSGEKIETFREAQLGPLLIWYRSLFLKRGNESE